MVHWTSQSICFLHPQLYCFGSVLSALFQHSADSWFQWKKLWLTHWTLHAQQHQCNKVNMPDKCAFCKLLLVQHTLVRWAKNEPGQIGVQEPNSQSNRASEVLCRNRRTYQKVTSHQLWSSGETESTFSKRHAEWQPSLNLSNDF